ncbi:MAG: cytochrome C [Burkholderiales bacterium RIFCSPLOWO2_12_67_14]|nr:MAG: cytochrome C [Burkholderiales bacterium RIFCSPLOWO2_02_FULL_67_64]OGB40928.1 MAG: cytochrome C [Burkholderiales bacterium RIFCSPLOWO2_12_67_14]OGB54372.1 MAG: cytochrome C [Burkholderiales bacterium RIFCSPHIGHO2_12_FULL_67_38]OGB78175.1 MAG: cytochrome C [Burkholderiales bacterium RIFCSPLOWO2_12_FULL_67_210]
MKALTSLALVIPLVVLSAPALAQFQKAEDAVKYRKSVLTVMGHHFGRIGAMANGRVPFDPKVAADNAALVETLSKLPFVAFGEGTDKSETRAKPEIWTDQAKFKQAAEKMQTEVAKLSAAAKTGSLDSVKAAFGAAGESCKACHDAFRKE